MRKFSFLFAVAITAFVAGVSNAAVVVTATSAPTTGLSGFETWTVRAASDGMAINGIDISFDGAMNQVNPFGLASIFQDNNGTFVAVGANASQDSQFLFTSSQVLSLNTSESATKLAGALTNLAALNTANAINFAQIVIPVGGSVAFTAGFDAGTGVSIPVTGNIGGGGGAVDPVAIGNPVSGSSISLQGAFEDGTGLLENAIVLTNGEPGSDPALAITSLVISNDAEGLFSATFDGLSIDLGLDIAKAIAGPGRNVSALLTVNTNGGVLTYNLGAAVPEPSTVALSALALVGLVGFARRKK
ncbi:PEP-CTERM sorting domain-containing protein [Aeoliella sp. SH292]|uniref:PEP-CTERM sorting domain-containing protein n=1 Tax=Aeoliella sp. SH292 TaxID=3454464 RepID=UPI003F947143